MRVTVAAREPATGAHPEASQALQQPVRSQAKAGTCSPLSLHIWILLVSTAWPLHPLCFTNTEEKACSAPVPPAVRRAKGGVTLRTAWGRRVLMWCTYTCRQNAHPDKTLKSKKMIYKCNAISKKSHYLSFENTKNYKIHIDWHTLRKMCPTQINKQKHRISKTNTEPKWQQKSTLFNCHSNQSSRLGTELSWQNELPSMQEALGCRIVEFYNRKQLPFRNAGYEVPRDPKPYRSCHCYGLPPGSESKTL